MRRSGNTIRIGLVAALLAGCGDEGEPPTAGEVLREGVEMVLIDMRTFVSRVGVRRARLEADTAEFMGESEIHLRPVSLTFFDELGRESSVITADFGIFYEL
ncbi:MAG: hypothetical protein R3266_10935, partial [Gemmatimonadota bacterium]|nr:hypothetical protein [Gemmatimonadota bacterium]